MFELAKGSSGKIKPQRKSSSTGLLPPFLAPLSGTRSRLSRRMPPEPTAVGLQPVGVAGTQRRLGCCRPQGSRAVPELPKKEAACLGTAMPLMHLEQPRCGLGAEPEPRKATNNGEGTTRAPSSCVWRSSRSPSLGASTLGTRSPTAYVSGTTRPLLRSRPLANVAHSALHT